MWLNALAATVLAACIAAGAWSGALATGLRIATLALAYTAAVVLGPALAPQLGAWFGLSGLLGTVAAGSAIFFVAYLVLGIAARFAKTLGPRENTGRSPRDRFLGATLGAVRGALLALMVVYLAMWFDALRATGTATVLPEIGDSIAADITSGVVQSAMDTHEPAGRFTARFAAHPADAATELQSILDDPAFARLRGDARFWSDVEDGNLAAALQRNSFFNVAGDAQLRRKAANLGLVSEEAALDPDSFRQSIAQVLEEIGPRLRGLHRDPAVQQLLADPAVVAMLESGDTLGLLANPKFRELVSRVSAAPGS